MKNSIYYITLLLCVAFPLLYGCEDYVEGITPDAPEVVKPEAPGLIVQTPILMFDASGMAVGLDIRSIGSGWQVSPGETCPWLEKISPEEGEAGNNIIAITLSPNNGLEERKTFVVVKHLGTSDTTHIAIRQYTHESKYNRQTDSLGLLAIYRSLSSEDYVWRNPWDEKKPITTWKGLTFENIRGEQRVIGINIFEFSLYGELPNEIGNLRELKTLSIRGGKVGGRVPNSITSLRKLEEIKIDFPDFASWFVPESIENMQSLKTLSIAQLKIDMSSFNRLYKLPNLESMTIAAINGDLPEGISAITKLKTLNFSGSKIASLPEDFGNLPNLEELNLNNCGKLVKLCDNLGLLSNLQKLQLTSCNKLERLPESIGDLHKVSVLTINGCEELRTIPESFTRLTRLTTLNFSNCTKLEGLPSGIGNMAQITSADFGSCSALKTLPESFGNLTLLKILQLRSCNSLVSLPESIGNLIQVTEISMSGCNALESLPASIGNMANLKKITLTCTGPVALPASFGNLSKLEEISFSQYTPAIGITGNLSILSTCTALKKLDASNNSLAGDPSVLSALPNLTVIKLAANKLSNPLNLKAILNNKITEIDFSGCNLTGTLDGLTQGTALLKVNLSNNLLSGTLPNDIEKCSKLTNLNVSENEITGNIPVGVIQLNLTYSGLMLKNNHMSGTIDAQILNSAGWKQKWYPDNNIIPQKEGYGFNK